MAEKENAKFEKAEAYSFWSYNDTTILKRTPHTTSGKPSIGRETIYRKPEKQPKQTSDREA